MAGISPRAPSARRRASAAGLLGALAVYVVITAGVKLWSGRAPSSRCPAWCSPLLAIPLMYWLARRKLRLADALGSRAMRTDAVESITCGWLAFVVVAALLAQALVGAWWIDPVASLAIVWFLVREAREAWSGDDCCGCG